jgi:hypothetical protein
MLEEKNTECSGEKFEFEEKLKDELLKLLETLHPPLVLIICLFVNNRSTLVLIGHFFFVTLFLYTMPMIPSGPKGLTEKTIDGQKDLCRDEKLLKKTRKRERCFAIDLLKNKSVDEIPNFILKTLPEHVRDGVFGKLLSGYEDDYRSFIDFSKTSGGAHDCSLKRIGHSIEYEARENKRKFVEVIEQDINLFTREIEPEIRLFPWLASANNTGRFIPLEDEIIINKPVEIRIFDCIPKLFFKQIIDITPRLKPNSYLHFNNDCRYPDVLLATISEYISGTVTRECESVTYKLTPHKYSKSLKKVFAYYLAHMIKKGNTFLLQNSVPKNCTDPNFELKMAILGGMLSCNDVDFVHSILVSKNQLSEIATRARLAKMPERARSIVECYWRQSMEGFEGEIEDEQELMEVFGGKTIRVLT